MRNSRPVVDLPVRSAPCISYSEVVTRVGGNTRILPFCAICAALFAAPAQSLTLSIEGLPSSTVVLEPTASRLTYDIFQFPVKLGTLNLVQLDLAFEGGGQTTVQHKYPDGGRYLYGFTEFDVSAVFSHATDAFRSKVLATDGRTDTVSVPPVPYETGMAALGPFLLEDRVYASDNAVFKSPGKFPSGFVPVTVDLSGNFANYLSDADAGTIHAYVLATVTIDVTYYYTERTPPVNVPVESAFPFLVASIAALAGVGTVRRKGDIDD